MSPAAPAAGSPREYVARGFRRPPTRSGRAVLVPLDDVDARAVQADDVLVVLAAGGLAPVTVVVARTGVAGEDPDTYEVPVIDGRVASGQVLAFDPRELCRVVSRKGPAVRA